MLALNDAANHLPNLTMFNGILDMVSLLCLMELGNIVSEWTYSEVDNPLERLRLMAAWKYARQLRHWVFTHYRLVDMAEEAVDYRPCFYWPYLAQQAQALVTAKKEAEEMGYTNHPLYGCTVQQVEGAVERSMKSSASLWRFYKKSRQSNVSTFAWTGPQFKVVKLDQPGYDGLCNN